jgi:hypothetical protein
MKTTLILILIALLSGCNSYQPNPNFGRAMQAWGQGWQQAREQREARELRRQQTQYYQHQNNNAWRNY